MAASRWPRASSNYKPTKAGGGGTLKLLWWQGPTLLNPHFAVGTKDQDGSRIFYEPLAGWDPDGNLVPILAAEIPSVENGDARQGRQVGRLEAEAGRQMARRPAVHRRRLRLQLGIRLRPGDRGDDDRHLQGHQGQEDRRPHDPRRFPEADAVLGRRLCRRARHDHPEAPVREVQGRQLARGADQPDAGRHRPLPVRRLQAGRSRPRQDQPELPHAEPALFRRDRDEGRRRRGVGRARRAADRRIRFRLEHAGRGRDPEAPRRRRQRPRRASSRAAISSTSSSTTPTPGRRSTASARASRPSTRS